MKRLATAALASVTIIASLALPIANVSAAKRDNLLEKLLDYMDKNGTYYYNPRGFAESCLTGIGSYDGVASAGLSGLQSEFVDKYHEIAAQLGSQYGIPWEAVVAQGILESASGTSRYARERNNFFGIGAVDSNPDNAHSFSSEAEGSSLTTLATVHTEPLIMQEIHMDTSRPSKLLVMLLLATM